MRVTILHRYFWPQKYPYAQMLKDIAESIKNLDCDLDVVTTSDGSDGENHQRQIWSDDRNINIIALRLGSEKQYGLIRKSLSAIYYGVWVFFLLILRRSDVVMVATTPPVIMAVIVRWAAYLRSFKYIYHCQDIHPEAMLLNSNIKEGVFYRFLLRVDEKNIDQAWRVITLSEDMRNTLKNRGCRVDHIRVINNFAFEIAEIPQSNKPPKSNIRFLFSGSLGRFQNLEMLMQALVCFRDLSDVEFVFMGDGILRNKMNEIKEEHQLGNVHLLGQRSMQEAAAAMRNADIGIVSIAPNIGKVAYPSKSIMYLGNGLPVLALVDDDTELSNFIKEKKVGVTAIPTSVTEIEKGIARAIDMCRNNPVSKDHINQVSYAHFGKPLVLEKISSVFMDEQN